MVPSCKVFRTSAIVLVLVATTSLVVSAARSDVMGMPSAQVKEAMGQLFGVVDLDKSGTLSEAELKAWLLKIREAVQRKQVMAEMESIDKNGDHKVTFEEMRAAYAEGQTASDDTLAELSKRFKAVDKDKDNALSLAEISLLMNPGTDKELMELEVQEILNAQDKDKDDKIGLNEFMQTEESLSPEEKEQYETEFATYDTNHDGFIDRDEIRRVVADPHSQEIEESLLDVRAFSGLQGDISREDWMVHFEKLAASAATDNGVVLRFPSDYGLPFKGITRTEATEDIMDDIPEEREEEL